MKAVVAAFNQEKALVGAFSVIAILRMELFQALIYNHTTGCWGWGRGRGRGWWAAGRCTAPAAGTPRRTRAWDRGSWAALEQGTGSLIPGGKCKTILLFRFWKYLHDHTCICTAGQSGGGAAGSILCLLPRHGSSVDKAAPTHLRPTRSGVLIPWWPLEILPPLHFR